MEDNIAKKQLNRTKSTAQVLIVIICAIIAASIISGAAFDVTRISGRSMDDTLYGGKSVGLYDDAEYNSSHFDVIRQDTAFDVLFFGRQDTLGDKALLLRTKKARRGDIVVFMHESFSAYQLIGAIVIHAGVYIANISVLRGTAE